MIRIIDELNNMPNVYCNLGVGKNGIIHSMIGARMLKYISTLQFYDPIQKTFLNGRQVVGKCPFENCQSEKAYADECDLGHQYMPKELVNPISTLSGVKPELREINNWYFSLEDCTDLLIDWTNYLEKNTITRQYVIKEIREF